MKRLTTDRPDGNFETMLNFVYGKDGWAHIRYDGENADVPLTEWARKQCMQRECYEFPEKTEEDIDLEICDCMMDYPGCPVALAYCFASQAVHMRSRLKMYEDILFAENGEERISLVQLRAMTAPPPNPPLILEELREMEIREWCWVEIIIPSAFRKVESCYYRKFSDYTEDMAFCCGWPGTIFSFDYAEYGKTWLAYRRKPEEGST